MCLWTAIMSFSLLDHNLCFKNRKLTAITLLDSGINILYQWCILSAWWSNISGTLPRNQSRKRYSIQKYVNLDKFWHLTKTSPLRFHPTGTPQLHPTFQEIFYAWIASKPKFNCISHCRNSAISIIVSRRRQSLQKSPVPKGCYRQMC